MTTPKKNSPQVVTLDSPSDGNGANSDQDVAVIAEINDQPQTKKRRVGPAEHPRKSPQSKGSRPVGKVSPMKNGSGSEMASSSMPTVADHIPPVAGTGPTNSGFGFGYRPSITGIGSHGLRFRNARFSMNGPALGLPQQFMRHPFRNMVTPGQGLTMNQVAPRTDTSGSPMDPRLAPGQSVGTRAPSQVFVASGLVSGSTAPPTPTASPAALPSAPISGPTTTGLSTENGASEGSSSSSSSRSRRPNPGVTNGNPTNPNMQAKNAYLARRLQDGSLLKQLIQTTQANKIKLKEKSDEIQKLNLRCIAYESTKKKFEEHLFRLMEELRKKHMVIQQKDEEIKKLKNEVKMKNEELVEIKYPWVAPVELNCVCPKCLSKW